MNCDLLPFMDIISLLRIFRLPPTLCITSNVSLRLCNYTILHVCKKIDRMLDTELINQRLYALTILTCTFKLPSIEFVPIYILISNVWKIGLIWKQQQQQQHFFWSSTARFLVILHCRQIAATSIWVVTTSTSCSVYRDAGGILWANPEVTVLKFLNTSYDSRPCAPTIMVLGSFPWPVIISAVSWNLNLFAGDPCTLKCEWSINKRRSENVDLGQ